MLRVPGPPGTILGYHTMKTFAFEVQTDAFPGAQHAVFPNISAEEPHTEAGGSSLRARQIISYAEQYLSMRRIGKNKPSMNGREKPVPGGERTHSPAAYFLRSASNRGCLR